MNKKVKKPIVYSCFSILSHVLLVTPVLFVLSPVYIFLAVKLSWKKGSSPVIKVKKANSVSHAFSEYRFNPLLARKSKIVKIGNKILEKYSMLTAIVSG